MTGNYRIELSIGRFPATSVSQIQNLVAKSLAYERTPYASDSAWFLKGTIVVREDGATPPDDVYWENARYFASLWRSASYTQIDTFSRLRGQSSTDVVNAINNGRMFVVYRGEAVSNWWSPFPITPDNLSNGSKTPIVVSSTCQTMSVSDNSYLGNTFLNAGSSSVAKGAVSFFGTTIATSGPNLALNRGMVAKGFFKAIFEDRNTILGDAAKYGKFYLDSIQPPNYSTARYSEWELFGDPELHVWLGKAFRINVVHDTVIGTQPQTFNVTVQYGSAPWVGATVCLMMDTTIYQVAPTNTSGVASFNINPTITGTMYVTVTGSNVIPYEGAVRVRLGSIDHDVGVVSIIEPSGIVASGTNVVPKVKVKNFAINADSFTVYLRIGSVYNQNVSQTLAPGDTTTVTFPAWTAVTGNYTVTAFTLLNDDQYRVNDTAYTNLSVAYTHDVGSMTIISPDSTAPRNVTLVPVVKIRNYGSSAENNFAVTCSIVNMSGNLRYTNTQTISSLTSGDTVHVTFTSWTPTVAEVCIIKVRTDLVGDQDLSNDAITKVIQISALCLSEGFNSDAFPPSGWQAIIIQGSYNWERRTSNTNPDCTPYEGGVMASYPSYTASAGSMARLITPPLSLGTTAIGCTLKFMMYHDLGYASYQDSVKIEYSFDGTNFNRVAAFRRYEPVSGWQEHSVYLGSFAGTVYIGFLAYSEFGDNINIDYIRIFNGLAITEGELSPLSVPRVTKLDVIRPNPVTNGLANISFSIGEPTQANLNVYDATGKLIKTLVNAELGVGNYNYVWNGKDRYDRDVAKGIYFTILETPKQHFSQKLILTR
jgi:hypothetical protein